MRAKKVSPVSVNIELRTLKASFSLAMRWKLITENPFAQIGFIKVPEQQPTYIRKEDFGKLILAIPFGRSSLDLLKKVKASFNRLCALRRLSMPTHSLPYLRKAIR